MATLRISVQIAALLILGNLLSGCIAAAAQTQTG